MEHSEILFKYPCGCVGLGKPHPPSSSTEDGRVWTDVLVVLHCKDSYDFQHEGKSGWVLPAPRLLVAPQGEEPVPLPEQQEEEYWEFLRKVESK